MSSLVIGETELGQQSRLLGRHSPPKPIPFLYGVGLSFGELAYHRRTEESRPNLKVQRCFGDSIGESGRNLKVSALEL
jgi:hypothetical protein